MPGAVRVEESIVLEAGVTAESIFCVEANVEEPPVPLNVSALNWRGDRITLIWRTKVPLGRRRIAKLRRKNVLDRLLVIFRFRSVICGCEVSRTRRVNAARCAEQHKAENQNRSPHIPRELCGYTQVP